MRMRAREACACEAKKRQEEREKRDPGFEYIFRDGLYLTPLSHDVAIAVGEIGVPQAAIGAPLCRNNDVGTAPATPILERVDAVRRRMLFLLASYQGRESIPVSFSFVSFASLSLSPIPSVPSPPSLSPPSAGCASLPLFGTPSVPRLLSHFHICLSRTIVLFLCRFATASRTPFPLHALDVDVPPPPGTGERTSPSRITPRPRERSVTTKVLVKS